MLNRLVTFGKLINRFPCKITLIKPRFMSTTYYIPNQNIKYDQRILTKTIQQLGCNKHVHIKTLVKDIDTHLARASVQGVKPNVSTMNAILQAFLDKSVLVMMYYYRHLSTKIPPDTITYTILISSYFRGKAYLRVLELYETLKRSDLPLDSRICCGLLRGIAKLDNREKFSEALEFFKERGVAETVDLYNTRIEALIEFKAPSEKILELYYEVVIKFKPTNFTFAILLDYFANNRDNASFDNLKHQMSLFNVTPTDTILGIFIKHHLMNSELQKAQHLLTVLQRDRSDEQMVQFWAAFCTLFAVNYPTHPASAEAINQKNKLYSHELKTISAGVSNFIASLKDQNVHINK